MAPKSLFDFKYEFPALQIKKKQLCVAEQDRRYNNQVNWSVTALHTKQAKWQKSKAYFNLSFCQFPVIYSCFTNDFSSSA